MTRLLLARALGILLGALAVTLVWNSVQEFRWAQGIGYGVPVLQLLAAPLAALGAYRMWRRDPRALAVTAVSLALATMAGALAAWTYAVDNRSSAAFGALGGGIVFTIAVVLLARMALKPTIPDPSHLL